jgi:uncharacterized protein
MERWMLGSPPLVLLAETDRHPAILEAVIRQASATGNQIHDAHIVALYVEHRIPEIFTGDRDFSRFKGVRAIDPFTGS